MTIQGSAAWFADRCGCVTASRISDILARTKSGHSASRASYCAQLVAERLTGIPAETYTNGAMQWGIEKEPEARAAYCFMRDAEVEEVGFIPHRHIALSGASPDGLVGDDGLVEIKCPETKTHIETLRGKKIPDKYITQLMWQLACTGRAWCDFVSYDPRMPEHMRLFVKRIARDDAAIRELEKEVRVFLAEVDKTLSDLHAHYGKEEDARQPDIDAGMIAP